MRVLIMILILMDYVMKDTTFASPCWPHPHCNTSFAFLCRPQQHCIECVLYICQNGVMCYSCECQTGYQGQHCTEKSPTTVDSTFEATSSFTPPAASTNKASSAIVSASTGGKTTVSSKEPATTAPTQHSSASTTSVAETTFNSLTNGSTKILTYPTISLPTSEVEPSTRSEEATSRPLSDAHIKSVPVSIIAGSIGGIVLIVLLTIGLVIFFRERKRRHASDYTENDDTKYSNDIHSNPANDALCAPADKVPTFFKYSVFGKHDESVEGNMMNGEYNTLRLHFPVTNEQQDNTHNHIVGSLTAESTYSHIPNCKDALFDNTYSHMANITHGKSLKPKDKDATYNSLGDSCSSKRNGKTEESRDETNNHEHMNRVRPTADQEDPGDNYSHINLSGLKAHMRNADEHRVDAQEPTRTNAEYAQEKQVTKIIDKVKKQHGDAVKRSTKTAEGKNNYEGHTYFVLESSTDQYPKQAPYDYAVAVAPEKDHTEFTVEETDTQHEYFVLEPTTELQ